MTITAINTPQRGRVHFLASVEPTQLDQVAELLGADFANSARYHEADKKVYTAGKLPLETKDKLEAAGFKPSSALIFSF